MASGKKAGLKERVYPFRAVERRLVSNHPGVRVLDIGCGVGENLTRLRRYGGSPIGIDPTPGRVRDATAVSPSVAAVGEALPFRDASVEMVYISHVLHHARDIDTILRESFRVLVPGGLLFLIETVEDSPLLRLARRFRPRWDGDEVTNRFRYSELRNRVERHGFELRGGTAFNWIFFAWELLPMAFRPLEILTPLFIALESLLRRPLARWGAHAWLVAVKPGDSSMWGEVRPTGGVSLA